MSDPLAIYGVALGAAGCVASAASAVYFRSQARAAHRQSDVADRVALMESNLEMYSRFRETRNQFLQFPNLQTMQDVYFLRKDGVVTDQYWHVWTNTFFRFYAKMPTFLRVFQFAAEEGLLHPEFVTFYRDALDGSPLVDPVVEATGSRRHPTGYSGS